MWTRDITYAIAWALAKGFCLLLMIALAGGVWALVTGEIPVDKRGESIFAILVLGPAALWIFNWLTALPLLVWRRRKFHVFRVLRDENKNKRALQIRLFGIWFYIRWDGSDAEPWLSLSQWTEFTPMYTWRKYDDAVMRREIEILINKIKPPAPIVENDGDIVYEKYSKKS